MQIVSIWDCVWCFWLLLYIIARCRMCGRTGNTGRLSMSDALHDTCCYAIYFLFVSPIAKRGDVLREQFAFRHFFPAVVLC